MGRQRHGRCSGRRNANAARQGCGFWKLNAFERWNSKLVFRGCLSACRAEAAARPSRIRKQPDAILPDIIVHHRGLKGRKNNLLVIEMKKDAVADPCDKKKVELFATATDPYQYQLGSIHQCAWRRIYMHVVQGRLTAVSLAVRGPTERLMANSVGRSKG